jgi:hypothetical protein
MIDGELPDRLMTRPVPQREILNDGSSVMKWRVAMSQPTTMSALAEVSKKLSDENFSVLPEQVGAKEILFSIVARPGVSYSDLWDFASRSLLTVEKRLGEIVSIENTPRDDWKLQFVVAEHIGAFADDQTPIMAAAEKGEISELRTLLSSTQKCDLDEATPFGFTALGYAALKGHLEIIELLLGVGANPNATGEVTTLQAGVLGGLESVRLLIQSGADVDFVDRYGETALMSAAASGRLDIVKELLKTGADPKLRDKKGNTALRHAQRNQRMEIVDLLKQI